MTTEPNDYTRKLLAAADEGGWVVTEYDLKSPGYVTLSDSRETEITSRSRYGLDTEFYIRQLRVRPRERPAEDRAR